MVSRNYQLLQKRFKDLANDQAKNLHSSQMKQVKPLKRSFTHKINKFNHKYGHGHRIVPRHHNNGNSGLFYIKHL